MDAAKQRVEEQEQHRREMHDQRQREAREARQEELALRCAPEVAAPVVGPGRVCAAPSSEPLPVQDELMRPHACLLPQAG